MTKLEIIYKKDLDKITKSTYELWISSFINNSVVSFEKLWLAFQSGIILLNKDGSVKKENVKVNIFKYSNEIYMTAENDDVTLLESNYGKYWCLKSDLINKKYYKGVINHE